MSPATLASLSDPPSVPRCGKSPRTVPSDCARPLRSKMLSHPVTVPLTGRLAGFRAASKLLRARAASCQVLPARTSESEGAASVSSRAWQHHRQGPTHPGPAGPDEAPADGPRLRPCVCMLAELRLRSRQARAAWTHSWRIGRDPGSKFGPTSVRVRTEISVPWATASFGVVDGFKVSLCPNPVNPAKLLARLTSHRAKFGPKSVQRIRGGSG